METAIRQTIDYTQERKAFGKSILDNQCVHFRLAELETEVEALRSMIYRATGKNLYNVVVITFLCCSPSSITMYAFNQITHCLVLLALLMEGHDVTKLASMAKLKAGRLVREVADGCLQFWGGMGYTQVSYITNDCSIRIFK